MIKTILVATDGSSHARKAVAFAAESAAAFKARLVIAHALLHDADAATLRKLANRGALSKEQRRLLDNYEVDAQLAMAASGVETVIPGTVPPPPEVLELVGQAVVERAAEAAKKAGAKRVATALLSGDPAEAILARAKREKAHLIVLGTRGRNELKSLLLGSVSHKVAAEAHCAVTTVK
jgi:nucleotide-binding universal stress UspA family protein